MILIFDIETNGYLDTLDTIHSLVALDYAKKEIYSFNNKQIDEGIELLSKASLLVGHNIISFDLPALQKVMNFKPKCQIFDTLNVSRLIYPDQDIKDQEKKMYPKKLWGKHSLEAWGIRLGIHKGNFGKSTDWSEWSQEMQDYCEQDVHVTAALYDKILSYNRYDRIQRAIGIEHEFQKIIHNQEVNGILFDVEKAKKYANEIETDIKTIRARILSRIPFFIKRKGSFTPKRDNSTLGYRAGVPFDRISIDTFNPGSRVQIIEYLQQKYNWKPSVFTDKGNPKVDGEVLRGLEYEEASWLADYFEREKVLGYIKTGKNAWLKLQKNGRIFGKVITNGTPTGRARHFGPNVAQVPSIRAFMGRECRSLFNSGSGWMVGADASGLELRMLAHYLYKYDGGAYAREILDGDIHIKNQQAAGLETRDIAKTFIYMFIYGGGDQAIGELVSSKKGEKAKEVGRETRKKFLSEIKGLNELISDVKYKSLKNKGVIGLDKRFVPCDSEHKALNYLLQSAGAIVMKQATINFWKDNKFNCYQVLHIHDEFEVISLKEKDNELIGQHMVDSITQAGIDFNLRIKLDGEYKIGKNWAETH